MIPITQTFTTTHLLANGRGLGVVSFGGDWRAHYKIIDDTTVLFVAVGTHSQLYK
jgi:mRNA-degrading endonuclease YafQ of YafQ-DinJ toxin-antitoxin module